GRPAAQGQGQGRAPAGRDPVAWNQTRNPGSDPSGMGRSSPHAPSDDHRRDHRCIHLRGRARRRPGVYGGGNVWWLIPLAAVIGIPLYVRLETMLPVALALSGAGVAIGPIFAMLIGGAGASPPEISM